jgi:hypothetical protein
MNPEISKWLKGFVKNPAATPEVIDQATSTLGVALPTDYLEIFRHMNGGEGFVGASYLRFYPIEKVAPLNQAYAVEEFAPGLLIFGSSGGGEAFAFDTRTTPLTIVEIPFIPMDFGYLEQHGSTLKEFLDSLAKEEQAGIGQKIKGILGRILGPTSAINPELVGKEIHEVVPIIFGGSPTDPKNKVLVTPEKYAEAVVAWNRQYYDMKGKQPT